MGGAPRWAQAIVAMISAIALAATTSSRRRFDRVPALLVLLLAAVAWTGLQVVPLPEGVVEILSPTLHRLRADGVELARVSVPSTLSMDPAATLRSLSFLLTLSAVAIVALRVASSERGRYALLASVALTAGGAALIAAVHQLVDATHLYGLYEPQSATVVAGPLLNPNHLGCLLALGTVTSLGLLLYPKQSAARRTVWVATIIACVAVAMATLSRGATIALALGAFVTLVILFGQKVPDNERKSRKHRQRFFATTVPMAVIVLCTVTIGVYVGADSMMQQLENTSLDELHHPKSKFAAWRSSMDLVEESPWVGTGRGGFETSFTRVHPASAFVTFSHPENASIQALVEWGVPATILFAVLGAWVLVLAIRRWRDGPLAASSLGAIVIVAFQSNVDFGLELLGLAVPAIIVGATVTYAPLREASPTNLRRARVLRVLQIVAVVAAAAMLSSDATKLVSEHHRELNVRSSTQDVLTSVSKHPLDYYGYALLAQQALQRDESLSIKLLNHALRLHPTHAGLHRLAARLLAAMPERLGQAEAEYANALRFSADITPVLDEMSRVLPRASLQRTIPLELNHQQVVRALQRLGHSWLAVAWLEQVVRYRPALDAIETLYSLAMSEKQYEAAEAAARARCTIVPGRQCQLTLARILAMSEKHAEIISVLADVRGWSGRRDEQLTAWFLLCDAYKAVGQEGDARACLRQLEASGIVRATDPALVRRRDALAPATPPR